MQVERSYRRARRSSPRAAVAFRSECGEDVVCGHHTRMHYAYPKIRQHVHPANAFPAVAYLPNALLDCADMPASKRAWSVPRHTRGRAARTYEARFRTEVRCDIERRSRVTLFSGLYSAASCSLDIFVRITSSFRTSSGSEAEREPCAPRITTDCAIAASRRLRIASRQLSEPPSRKFSMSTRTLVR
jgi:hypothetical protein